MCDEGEPTKLVAEAFEVSPAWVRRLKQRRRELKTIAPLVRTLPDQHKLNDQDRRRLKGLVERQPDATLAELNERLGNKVGISTLWRALRDLRLSLKKSPCTPPSRTARTSAPDARSGTWSWPASTPSGSCSSTSSGPPRR
jgi:transposase